MPKHFLIPSLVSLLTVALAATNTRAELVSPWALLILVVASPVSWAATAGTLHTRHETTRRSLAKLERAHARELAYAMRLEAKLASLTKTRLLPPVVWVSLTQLERVCRLAEGGLAFARDTWAKARMAHRYQIRGYQDADAYVWPLPAPLPEAVAAELGEAHVERSRRDFLP